MIEITRLTKRGGPLTKRISLASDGNYQSDGGACVMAEGEGYRVALSGVVALADLLGRMSPHEALAMLDRARQRIARLRAAVEREAGR